MTEYHELFKYRDGGLYWSANRSNVKAGDRAGSFHTGGYRRVKVNGENVMEHRVIYEMHHGPIPEGMEIDHINGDPADNRIKNLRVVTSSENKQNQKTVKGFSFHKAKGKFLAQIMADGKTIHLGYHETPVDANAAYLRAKREHHINETYRHG